MILIILLFIVVFLKYFFYKENFLCEWDSKLPIEKTNIETIKKKFQDYETTFSGNLQIIKSKQSEILNSNSELSELLSSLKNIHSTVLDENNYLMAQTNNVDIQENNCKNSNNIKLSAIRNIYS